MKYKIFTDENNYLLGFEHTNTTADTIELEPTKMDLYHINCYKLVGSNVILDSEKLAEVIEEEKKKAAEPTEIEVISAQVLYTAVMTDTLIEKEGE